MDNNPAKSKKQHLYVEAYEKIEEMIRNNSLAPGDQLPSESELMVQLGVSRGTLRQALALLREDGVIYSQRGKGYFIRAQNEKDKAGMEKVHTNPIVFATVPMTRTELVTEYFPSSKKVQEYLEVDEIILTANFHVTYYSNDEIIAYRLYFIPYEYLKAKKVDLFSESEMLYFVSTYIDEHVSSSNMTLACVEASRSVAERMHISLGTPLLYFAEKMRMNSGEVALFSKAYYIPNFFQFRISRE